MTNQKKLEEIEFEKYLMAEHAKDYHGTDDNMPDDFEYWLENLEQEDIIKYANNAINSLLQEIEEKVIGDRKSVEELEPMMNDAINDFANKVCFKEGYNQSVTQQRKALKTIKERYTI